MAGQKIRTDTQDQELIHHLQKIQETILPALREQLDMLESVAPTYNTRAATSSLTGNGFYCFIRVNRNVVRKLTQALLYLDSPRNRRDPKGLQELDYWIRYMTKAIPTRTVYFTKTLKECICCYPCPPLFYIGVCYLRLMMKSYERFFYDTHM